MDYIVDRDVARLVKNGNTYVQYSSDAEALSSYLYSNPHPEHILVSVFVTNEEMNAVWRKKECQTE